jgi:hypothetical protein
MKTAKEVLEAIDQLSNEERWKLLERMHDKFYSKGENYKLDIDFLTDKVNKLEREVFWLKKK